MAPNPNVQPEAASSKQELTNGSPAVSIAAAPHSIINGMSEGFEHLKDLQKSLRNTLKKLNATSKVDAIIAQNPDKSLDDLIAEKKINMDQKAQVLKKPTLQATVTQLEEQINHYKQFAAYYEERLESQKEALVKAHQEEIEAVREKVAAEATETGKDAFKKQLLTLSRFLCAAASMRRSGDQTSLESRAFEGVLYQVYGGTPDAVVSMLKLIEGSEEGIVGVDGETLDFTYAKVNLASENFTSSSEHTAAAQETAEIEGVTASDPTVSHAGLTELQDAPLASKAAVQSGAAVDAESQEVEVPAPVQTLATDAANAVAESSWEPSASAGTITDEWVEVPRDPAETDTGLNATPAAVESGINEGLPASQAVDSRVEEMPAAVESASPKEEGNDGFEAVIHHPQRQYSGRGRGGRGRGRGDGYRGRGGRGEFRGRGRPRGDYRGGRGRGGYGGQQGNSGNDNYNGNGSQNGNAASEK